MTGRLPQQGDQTGTEDLLMAAKHFVDGSSHDIVVELASGRTNITEMVAALAARLRASEADSRRLDWLAWDNGNGPIFDGLSGFDVHDHANEYQDERTAYCAAFRVVIDAAMAESTATEEQANG